MNFDYNKKNYIAKNTDVLHGEFFKALNNFLAFFLLVQKLRSTYRHVKCSGPD